MTQNTKHTPGLWRYGLATGSFSHYRVDAGDQTPVIAAVIESEANARLIAAAPDLLAACLAAEERIRELSPQGYVAPEMWTLRAAIAKATGDA